MELSSHKSKIFCASHLLGTVLSTWHASTQWIPLITLLDGLASSCHCTDEESEWRRVSDWSKIVRRADGDAGHPKRGCRGPTSVFLIMVTQFLWNQASAEKRHEFLNLWIQPFYSTSVANILVRIYKALMRSHVRKRCLAHYRPSIPFCSVPLCLPCKWSAGLRNQTTVRGIWFQPSVWTGVW